MPTVRDRHWNDAPLDSRLRRRVIGHWLNYRTPHHGYVPAAPAVDVASRIPDDWGGDFDFALTSAAGAMQSFAAGTRDPDNSAWWGVRSSEHPEAWLNFRALDVQPVKPSIDTESRTVHWRGLWPGADLSVQVTSHQARKVITVRERTAPTAYRLSVLGSPGHTLEVAGDVVRLLDEAGAEVLRTNPPWALDSSTTALSPDGRQSLRVSVVQVGDFVAVGRRGAVVEVRVDADDFARAVLPVQIDPTVVVSGTSAIEDNSILQAVPDYNLGEFIDGGRYTAQSGNTTNERRCLIRMASLAIPGGTITAVRLASYRIPIAVSANAGQALAFRVLPANDWVEGTGSAVVQDGSSNWNHAKRATQAWAGSAGCGTSGVDYAASASPPGYSYAAYTSGPIAPFSFEVEPEWFSSWRDGDYVNNGLLLRPVSAVPTNDLLYMTASEDATYPLTFEIDYTPATKPLFFKLV